jgi:DNA-binding transcriptional regulator YiaG
MTEQRTEQIATTDEPYHFQESGLSNIYLVGIRYFVYESGKVIPEIPAIKSLMQLIARDLIEKPSALTGEEIRFLRKRLGKKQIEVAHDIGIEPETLSRCENGRQKLGESNDKFLRFYYAISALDDIHLNELRKEMRKMLSEWHEHGPAKKTVAKVTNDEWELTAA